MGGDDFDGSGDVTNEFRAMMQRLKARCWIIRNSGDAIKRRVRVENYLHKAAAGKEPLPNAQKCRELAVDLGVPTDWRKR